MRFSDDKTIEWSNSFMKTAILYYSHHHGNTRKLLKAIATQVDDVTLIDVTAKREVDLSAYDRIGLASGIYYASFAKQVLDFASLNLPVYKDVFFIATSGVKLDSHLNAVRKLAESKHCKILGEYRCLGYCTYGPFKLVGGVSKKHPTDEEIQDAVEFVKSLG